MENKLFILTILITIIGTISSCNKEIDYQKEEERIRELWSKTSEYLAEGDWENYSNLMDQSEKLQVIHPQMGQWLKGFDEVSPVYKSIVEAGNTYIEYKNELLNVNISKSGDMAWANAEVIWAYNDGENKNHMWYAFAFNKVDGEWKTVMAMACGVPNVE